VQKDEEKLINKLLRRNQTDAHEDKSELSKIAMEIRSITGNVKTETYRLGELLVKAKEVVGHGKFKKWVKGNFEFSYQTAQNFMNVYRHCLGRPGLVKTIKASILYMIASPDFPKDLREHILENGKKLKKIKNKKLRDIYRRFKEGELDLESPEIKGLFKKNKRRVVDEGYAEEISDRIGKIEKLTTTVLSITSKIEWPIHPSTKEVELEDDELKKVNQLLKKILNAVQSLRPGQKDQSEKPKLSLVA